MNVIYYILMGCAAVILTILYTYGLTHQAEYEWQRMDYNGEWLPEFEGWDVVDDFTIVGTEEGTTIIRFDRPIRELQ